MMLLKAAKKKFIRELAYTEAALTVGTVLVYHLFIPERYFQWFPLIPVFFYLFGLFYIYMFAVGYRWGGNKVAMTYLVCKVLKFVLSALILTFYGFVIGHEVMAFMGTFIFFYLAFLVFETRFFFRLEAKLKLSKQIKNEKDTVHSNNAVAATGNSGNNAEGGNRG